MWCWTYEQYTQREVCRALRQTNLRKCNSISLLHLCIQLPLFFITKLAMDGFICCVLIVVGEFPEVIPRPNLSTIARTRRLWSEGGHTVAILLQLSCRTFRLLFHNWSSSAPSNIQGRVGLPLHANIISHIDQREKLLCNQQWGMFVINLNSEVGLGSLVNNKEKRVFQILASGSSVGSGMSNQWIQFSLSLLRN